MKRVLIVDDEYLVRLGLKSTINWNAYGYQIAGEASNGKEALELFDQINPDILMTDIKMPVMDGLELLEQIKKRKKPVQLVILSNHDDFSYARKAMALGATRYLLKSEINEPSLIEVLQNLSIEAGGKALPPDSRDAARQQYLQEQLFGIPANTPINSALLEPPPPNLFTQPPYVAIKCSCTIEQVSDSKGSLDVPLQTLRSIVTSSLDLPEAVCCTSIYKEVVYLAFTGSVRGIGPERLEQLCMLITRNIKNYLGLDMRTGISEFMDAAQLPVLLAQAEQARSDSFFTRRSITVYTKLMQADQQNQVKVSHSKVKRLVHSGDQERLEAYIQTLFSQLEQKRSYLAVQSVFVDLISTAKSICEESSLNLTTGLDRVKFDYDILAKMRSLENTRFYVMEIYDTILAALSGKGGNYSYTITNCLAYIAEHYADSITLEDTAAAMEISSSYLSVTFKQEMGINFISYLTQYRIQHAEKLLSETNLKIYEIAEKVGFSTPYYFSKVFKELKGMSCKEYRDRFFQPNG